RNRGDHDYDRLVRAEVLRALVALEVPLTVVTFDGTLVTPRTLEELFALRIATCDDVVNQMVGRYIEGRVKREPRCSTLDVTAAVGLFQTLRSTHLGHHGEALHDYEVTLDAGAVRRGAPIPEAWRATSKVRLESSFDSSPAEFYELLTQMPNTCVIGGDIPDTWEGQTLHFPALPFLDYVELCGPKPRELIFDYLPAAAGVHVFQDSVGLRFVARAENVDETRSELVKNEDDSAEVYAVGDPAAERLFPPLTGPREPLGIVAESAAASDASTPRSDSDSDMSD
ncbi:MAG TPA: hypothetical protein VFH51_19525, partial [Myxococcota bacterium]|nr:hypothetical protein [Myxococcota bacterium]